MTQVQFMLEVINTVKKNRAAKMYTKINPSIKINKNQIIKLSCNCLGALCKTRCWPPELITALWKQTKQVQEFPPPIVRRLFVLAKDTKPVIESSSKIFNLI